MARRIGAQPIEVAGVRGALIDNLEASLDRLVGADTDVYDFSVERERTAGMVADMRAGRDVCVQGWQIPRELRPANGKVFRLTGDQLVPEDYERGHHSPPAYTTSGPSVVRVVFGAEGVR